MAFVTTSQSSATILPFHISETIMMDAPASPSIFRRTRQEQSPLAEMAIQNEDEQGTTYTADDEQDDMSSTSSGSYNSDSLSLSAGEEVDKLDDRIPGTIIIPSGAIEARTVSSDENEKDLSRKGKKSSKPDLRHVFESFDTPSPSWMINEGETPELAYESSWTTASINTPDFLMEEDDMSLESLPVAAKLATLDVWNRIPLRS